MLIQNGRIINYSGEVKGDIRINNEQVEEIASALKPRPGEEVVDAGGAMILPGGVDVHTHFDMPAGLCMTSDDFAAGTRAALAGGTTTVIDFAEPDLGARLSEGLDTWRRKAEHKSYCDYAFHMTVSHWDETMREQMKEMTERGITSFKAYTAYQDSLGVSTGELRQILRAAGELGALLCVHCEDDGILCRLKQELRQRQPKSPASHPKSRPNEAERRAAAEVAGLALEEGVPVYLVHISTREGLHEIRAAREKGALVYAETCPHYLLLNDEKYELPGFEGAKYVMSPPLRKAADQSALWKGLQEGEIHTVATDHCSFDYKGQKELGKQDFTQIPGGIPSVEHRLLLLHHYGCQQGLSPAEIVRLTSYHPARIFGLFPKKGGIWPGSDADLVILKKTKPYVITAEKQMQKVDYTPYEGMVVSHQVAAVYLRGTPVVRAGRFVADIPGGQFLHRKIDKEGRL